RAPQDAYRHCLQHRPFAVAALWTSCGGTAIVGEVAMVPASRRVGIIPACGSHLGRTSVRTRSCLRSAQAGWAKSIAPATLGSIGKERFKFSARRSRALPDCSHV